MAVPQAEVAQKAILILIHFHVWVALARLMPWAKGTPRIQPNTANLNPLQNPSLPCCADNLSVAIRSFVFLWTYMSTQPKSLTFLKVTFCSVCPFRRISTLSLQLCTCLSAPHYVPLGTPFLFLSFLLSFFRGSRCGVCLSCTSKY
jgi:hypothetical protein